MASRSDISVIQQLSPRVAEVAQPSIEVVMQDYVDTMRDEEEKFQSMGHERLIDASGKQDLGGGTLVAITVEENNVQLAFEANTAPAHTGTVTTPSGPPSAVGRVNFSDSTADFITANVQPGSMVINFTDMSIADVVQVLSATELQTKTPSNGVGNEFDAADVIQVFNIRQCTTSGGNLVAKDENAVTIPAILPTAFTQVVLQTSSSATIQELTEIRYAAYQNAVWYQAGSGNSGVAYPNGTPVSPLDNFQDVKTLADSLGFDSIKVMGNATLGASDNLAGFNVVGQSTQKTNITVGAAANVTDSHYFECHLEGILDGVSAADHCHLGAVTDMSGEFHDCGLSSSITAAVGGSIELINCYSAVPGGGATPILVVGNADILGRDYAGGIEFNGKTGAGAVSWDFDSGQAIVNDNCSAGTITLRGDATWSNKDTYVGTTTVVDQLNNQGNTAFAVWDALIADHSVSGSFGEFVVRRLLTVAKFFAMR